MIGSAYAQKQPHGVTHEAQILRVTDGDTIVIAAAYLPRPLKPELSVRIWGVDTPELAPRAECAQEAEAARVASAYVRHLVQRARHTEVIIYSWDKYGGRILGDIVLDGQSLRESLVTAGHARPYYTGRRASWCR